MNLYRFAVIDPDNRNWAASTYKGNAAVCAPTQDSAIDLLSAATGKAASRPLGAEICMPPWYMLEVVKIEEIGDYDTDVCEPRIIEPHWLDREVAQ